MTRLLLASASPRRKTLLEWSGIAVEVAPSNIAEIRRPSEGPVDYALRLAGEKSLHAPANRIVLAADTVVHLDGRIFDKPRDDEDAISTLSQLSGRWHTVTTAVSIRQGARHVAFSVDTAVRFRDLESQEIQAYVQTGEAQDKAGAYGIQGRAGAFVAELQGSWTNVMGLPVEEVLSVLKSFTRSPSSE